MHKFLNPQFWKLSTPRLIVCALLCIAGIIIATTHIADVSVISRKLVHGVGILVYVMFAASALHILTSTMYRHTVRRIGASRASTTRFTLRIAGYVMILLGLLSLLHIPIAKLLFGGAIIGVILGVAAQQALANFFASVVIIIDRPFSVGQNITINSGALGGKYTGTVSDISFSHTVLKLEDGSKVNLPNATLLSGAAITRLPRVTAPDTAPAKQS